MDERGSFIDSQRPNLIERIERAKQSEKVHGLCESIAHTYGFYSTADEGEPLSLPSVQWGEADRVELILHGDTADALDRRNLESLPEAERLDRIMGYSFLFLSPELEGGTTVFSIGWYGNETGQQETIGPDGSPVSSQDISGILNDLERYRQSIEEQRV